MLLLGFEFSGDAYDSNPDWNNFKISSYISWSFFIHINTIYYGEKANDIRSSQSKCGWD